METSPPLSPICPPDWAPPSGDEIRAALQAAGWTQAGAAAALGVTLRSVGHWCQGRSAISWPTWHTLQTLLQLGPEEKVSTPGKTSGR